ncbi:hypothetical protein [Alicyclobacillus fodiniaquatilis]|uniref:Uncharacterized protein n=1 Tax=Alicyclobacillus fodiniaquatilis TaxID=1661150 RepID=A0ABW4JM18_9BACL
MDEKKRGRGRPPKDPTGLRKTKISTYVSEEIAELLKGDADARGMTISELVATVLEGYVFGDKKDLHLPPVPKDAVYAVMKVLAEEGLLNGSTVDGANVSPKTINSAEFAPKKSATTQTGAKGEKQRGDDGGNNVAPKTTRRRGKQGGENNAT